MSKLLPSFGVQNPLFPWEIPLFSIGFEMFNEPYPFKKKNTRTIPPTVIPRGFDTLYRCSLTTVAQDKPYHPWKTIKQGLLQPQGELYPIPTIFNHRSQDQLLEFCTRQLAVSSLSKGISSTLNFQKSIGTDGTQTRNLSNPKQAPYRLS